MIPYVSLSTNLSMSFMRDFFRSTWHDVTDALRLYYLLVEGDNYRVEYYKDASECNVFFKVYKRSQTGTVSERFYATPRRTWLRAGLMGCGDQRTIPNLDYGFPDYGYPMVTVEDKPDWKTEGF